ncbi:MAG: leucine-rich repeat domain-containing protein [Synergistaceae bacterium]|jgi:hypothetical protein|nr:leucine-rich repeat domain-containing protein [Synergistaceae bacterium]
MNKMNKASDKVNLLGVLAAAFCLTLPLLAGASFAAVFSGATTGNTFDSATGTLTINMVKTYDHPRTYDINSYNPQELNDYANSSDLYLTLKEDTILGSPASNSNPALSGAASVRQVIIKEGATSIAHPLEIYDLSFVRYNFTAAVSIDMGKAYAAPGAYIVPNATRGFTSLKFFYLPDGIQEIQSQGLSNNTVEEIILPKSIEYISNDAFVNSPNLTSLTLLSPQAPNVSGGTYFSNSFAKLKMFNIPDTRPEAGYTSSIWWSLVDKVGQNNGTTNIAVTINNVKANGASLLDTSSRINFSFDQNIIGLVSTDFRIDSGSGRAAKGELEGSGKEWFLNISDVVQGTVKVSVASNPIDFAIIGSPWTVDVYSSTATNPNQGRLDSGGKLNETYEVYLNGEKVTVTGIPSTSANDAAKAALRKVGLEISREPDGTIRVTTGNTVATGLVRDVTFTLDVDKDDGTSTEASFTFTLQPFKAGVTTKIEPSDEWKVLYYETTHGAYAFRLLIPTRFSTEEAIEIRDNWSLAVEIDGYDPNEPCNTDIIGLGSDIYIIVTGVATDIADLIVTDVRYALGINEYNRPSNATGSDLRLAPSNENWDDLSPQSVEDSGGCAAGTFGLALLLGSLATARLARLSGRTRG